MKSKAFLLAIVLTSALGLFAAENTNKTSIALNPAASPVMPALRGKYATLIFTTPGGSRYIMEGNITESGRKRDSKRLSFDLSTFLGADELSEFPPKDPSPICRNVPRKKNVSVRTKKAVSEDSEDMDKRGRSGKEINRAPMSGTFYRGTGKGFDPTANKNNIKKRVKRSHKPENQIEPCDVGTNSGLRSNDNDQYSITLEVSNSASQ